MCARKQGRIRDAIKIFKDVSVPCPLSPLPHATCPLQILRDSCSTHLGVTENLVEACLEMQGYADIQGLLVRYDGMPPLPPNKPIPFRVSRTAVSLYELHVCPAQGPSRR